MTTTRKLLPTLLLLLASWTGQVMADPPPQAPETVLAAQAPEQAAPRDPETRDRLAWQRVGSPTSLEA